MQQNVLRASLALLCLVFVSASAESGAVWFQKRVVWKAGREAPVWETGVVSPNGKERYRLALIPLWMVEGGIVGIEILVARPEHPDDNLLGLREMHVPQPFVITVEELESGISRSRFGATRIFNVGHAKLRVQIQGSRLSRGGGDCGSCRVIQEFTAELALGSR